MERRDGRYATALIARAVFSNISPICASVTISGGCATLVPADWQTEADLIAAADAALYIAKATGRDRIVAS